MENSKGGTYTGSISYHSSLPGIFWQPLTLASDDKRIRDVVISSSEEGDRLEIVVNFDGIESVEEALPFADLEARRIVNRLAFHFDTFIDDPLYNAGSVVCHRPDGTKEYREAVLVRARASGSANGIQILGGQSLTKMQSALERHNLSQESNYDLYRSIISGTDVIAKFLALYLILMSFHTDNQGQVENFIRVNEPGVLVAATNPPRQGKSQWTDETVYTRLRNQIGHNRGVLLEDTRSEMNGRLHGLMALVKKCLEQNG